MKTTQIKNPLIAEVIDILAESYEFTVTPYSGGYRVDGLGVKLEIRSSGGGAHLRVWAGPGITGQLVNSRYEDFYLNSSAPEDWRSPEELAPKTYPDTKVFGSASYLAGLASEVIDWAFENVTIQSAGVLFEGTNFAGYGERDFMAAVVCTQKSGYATLIPNVGDNLGFEFQVPSTGSRIDAVEFDAAGNVITVIECQSGIQHGAHLDDEHFAKAISRYPQSAEVRDSVKKIVVIAGGFSEAQLATFGQLPYEIVALKTVAINGKIVLEVVV